MKDRVPHEFIAIELRRYCISCSLFQHRAKGTEWPPVTDCPRDSDYARRRDKPCQP